MMVDNEVALSGQEGPLDEPGVNLEKVRSLKNGGAFREKVTRYHDALVQLHEEVCNTDIRSQEGKTSTELKGPFSVQVKETLEASAKLIDEIFQCCDSGSGAQEPNILGHSSVEEPSAVAEERREFEFQMDTLVSAVPVNQRTFERVADTAFIARGELKARSRRVASAQEGEGDSWRLLAEYDGAIRRMCKSLAAVEQVLADALNKKTRLDFCTELELSLSTRKAYYRLHRRITGLPEPDEKEIYARMRSAGTSLAMLIGLDIYPMLRIGDRAQLRELQTRILNWMRNERDPQFGLRIWQDFIGVVDILLQVSRRQELVEHDGDLVENCYSRLSACLDEEECQNIRGLMQPLAGIDPGLDLLLSNKDNQVPLNWLQTLEKLLVRFNRGVSAKTSAPVDCDFF